MKEAEGVLRRPFGNWLPMHGSMAVSDSPFRAFGIDYAPELKTVTTVVPQVLCLAFVFCNWT